MTKSFLPLSSLSFLLLRFLLPSQSFVSRLRVSSPCVLVLISSFILLNPRILRLNSNSRLRRKLTSQLVYLSTYSLSEFEVQGSPKSHVSRCIPFPLSPISKENDGCREYQKRRSRGKRITGHCPYCFVFPSYWSWTESTLSTHLLPRNGSHSGDGSYPLDLVTSL